MRLDGQWIVVAWNGDVAAPSGLLTKYGATIWPCGEGRIGLACRQEQLALMLHRCIRAPCSASDSPRRPDVQSRRHLDKTSDCVKVCCGQAILTRAARELQATGEAITTEFGQPRIKEKQGGPCLALTSRLRFLFPVLSHYYRDSLFALLRTTGSCITASTFCANCTGT